MNECMFEMMKSIECVINVIFVCTVSLLCAFKKKNPFFFFFC